MVSSNQQEKKDIDSINKHNFQYKLNEIQAIDNLIKHLEESYPTFRIECIYFLDIINRYICSIFLKSFNNNTETIDKYVANNYQKYENKKDKKEQLQKLKNKELFDSYGEIYKDSFAFLIQQKSEPIKAKEIQPNQQPKTVKQKCYPANINKPLVEEEKKQEKRKATSFLEFLKIRYIMYLKYTANEEDNNKTQNASEEQQQSIVNKTLCYLNPKNYYDKFTLADYSQAIKILGKKRTDLFHYGEIKINKVKEKTYSNKIKTPVSQLQYLQIILCLLPPKLAEIFINKINSYTIQSIKKSMKNCKNQITKEELTQGQKQLTFLHKTLQREKKEFIHELISNSITNYETFAKAFIDNNLYDQLKQENINIPTSLNKLPKDKRKKLIQTIYNKKNQRKAELVGYSYKIGKDKESSIWFKKHKEYNNLYQKVYQQFNKDAIVQTDTLSVNREVINQESVAESQLPLFYKPIPFKRIYYFIGEKNIKILTEVIANNSNYNPNKIKFSYIEKFYNANLEINNILLKYCNLIKIKHFNNYDSKSYPKSKNSDNGNKEANKQKLYRKLDKEIRNPLAHNDFFFTGGCELNKNSESNNIEQQSNSRKKEMGNIKMLKLMQNYLRTYKIRNYPVSRFNDEVKSVLQRLKLPIINNAIIKKINDKKIYKKKQEDTLYIDNNEPLVKLAKKWLKEFNYKKDQKY
ncbi:hypothetical protein HAV_00266 [Candidatus Hepatincola sp. Av]